MAARTMRKMHVPAYPPLLLGVHDEEYKGVMFEVKKTIDISDMVIAMLVLLLVESILLDMSIVTVVCDLW